VWLMSASSPRAVCGCVKQPSWQTARAVGESAKQTSVSTRRTGRIVVFLDLVSRFMVLPFFFPATLILQFAGPERAKNLAGKCPPPDQIRFNDGELRAVDL